MKLLRENSSKKKVMEIWRKITYTMEQMRKRKDSVLREMQLKYCTHGARTNC